MKIQLRNFISVLVLCVAVFFLGFTTARLMPEKTEKIVEPTALTITEPEKKPDTVSVMVDFGDGRIHSATDIAWHEGESVFDALKLYDDKASFGIKYKDYGGDLGVFVESIEGKTDPKKKAWWQYWVNNQYGKIGSSSYKLKAGDVVMWKLTTGQQ
ncbi:MAG: DUF4430 domain-containing protein [Patescibacteria group bacterium]